MFREFDNRIVAGLEGGKWVAIVLMACSHFGMTIGPEWLWPAFWIGRVCAPIFCFIIVARLFEKPLERSGRYLIRLGAWGVVSQLPYSAWTWDFGFHLNVMFTLGLGVAVIWAWARNFKPLAICLAGVTLYLGVIYDLGLIDPSFMFAGYLLYKRSPGAAIHCVSVLFAATYFYVRPHDWIAPAICMLVPSTLYISSTFSSRLTRLPGWGFYAFYPVHIGLIYVIMGPLPTFQH